MRQFAVIGLGRFGYSVAETLAKSGAQVLAIDKDPEKVEAVNDFVTNAVQCDATNEKALRAVGTGDVDVAIVGMGEDIEGSIMSVMVLKGMGLKEIIAKAVSPLHERVLKNIGVTRIIRPERDAGVRVANNLISPNILERLELSSEYSLQEIPVPEGFIGQKLKAIQGQTYYRINFIAIKKQVSRSVEGSIKPEEVFNFTPSSDDVLEKGDILIVIGREEDLSKLGRARG